MGDLSVRETAARIIARRWNMSPRNKDVLADADAVLAAVADHDGLADALRKHKPISSFDGLGRRWIECSGCDETARDLDRFIDAHLADVVRAWLKGGS